MTSPAGEIPPTRHTPLSRFGRGVLWFVAANALLGALSLVLFPSRTDTLFFWEIRPPINAALLGALYLAGAVVVSWTAYAGRWEQARVLVPVLVAAGTFIALTTLLHMDRFTPGIRLVYWLAVYIGAPLLALFLYVDHERRGARWAVEQPVTAAVRALALLTGALVVLAGLVLFVLAAEAAAHWPWTISPLMLRIFAAWFNGFGAGLLWFYVERDWRRLYFMPGLMLAAASLDLAMIWLHRDDLTTHGWRLWLYCFHLALFGLVGLVMHWLQRRAAAPGSVA